MSRYETQLFSYFQNLQNFLRVQPMILGGITASGGGIGGPPGGFAGVLPQTRVAYDLSELEDYTTPVSGTLLDNLNRIRYRIKTIELAGAPSSLAIYEDGVLVASGVSILDFRGPVDVDQPAPSTVTITVSGGTGGGHVIQDEGTSKTQRAKLNFIGSGVTVTDDSINDATKVTLAVEGHHTSHELSGSDAIKLDDLSTPDDNTDLDASIARHGLLLKLLGGTTRYLREDGAWAVPPASGIGAGVDILAVQVFS